LLTDDNHILLLQVREPATGRKVWLAPGGGVQPRERPAQALVRETLEATGHQVEATGPLIWTRRSVSNHEGRDMNQKESFYLVKVPRFDPVPGYKPDRIERDTFLEFRWWNLVELTQSQEEFSPRRAPHFLKRLVEEGPPEHPLDTGP